MNTVTEQSIVQEIEEIYGIDECKEKILNYVKYLEISKENHFANYNISIHNDSVYPSETKDKLVNFIYKMLKHYKIINSKYEVINMNNIDKIIKNGEIDSNVELIVIDEEKIDGEISKIRDNIISFMENNSNIIFILIDNSSYFKMIGPKFNSYFDWFFEIDQISQNNKKTYICDTILKNNISISPELRFVDKLSKEAFFKIKTDVNNAILICKLNNIEEITDEIANQYLSANVQEIRRKEKDKSKEKEEITFEDLVGVEKIKKEIDKIINYIVVCKKRNGQIPSLHMCFTGNPGTGKTTAARIIGNLFAQKKILANGRKFTEVQRADLIGEYVGQTAPKTKNVIDNANGGILFIDEAYTLSSYIMDEAGRDYGAECIATLLKEMEDKRESLCVILAGYEKEMDNLLKANPGFESRVQFKINFPDYTEEELYEIFVRMAKKENYKISGYVKKELIEYFSIEKQKENFSNGRFVRNLYEKIKMEQALRVVESEDENINLIKKCDIINVIKELKDDSKITVKRKIGFGNN